MTDKALVARSNSASDMDARGWSICMWQRKIGAFDLTVCDTGEKLSGLAPDSRCGWTLDTPGVQLSGTARTPEDAAQAAEAAAEDMAPDKGKS